MVEKIATIAASKGVVLYIPHNQPGELTITGSIRLETVFQLNVKGIDRADFFTMWADYELLPDPGTIWEQDRTYTFNKPVIALREDFNICRQTPTGQSTTNLMIAQSLDYVATCLT